MTEENLDKRVQKKSVQKSVQTEKKVAKKRSTLPRKNVRTNREKSEIKKRKYKESN